MKKLLLLLPLLLTAFRPAPAQITLNKGDHAAILGSTTADRMQHSGWFDTLVHAANPDKDIVMRHLAFAADEVATWHRIDGFGTRDEWLQRVKASVIFAFYGFNESFKGEAGLEKFKKDLEEFIKHTRESDYSGKGAPRLVLVSPIAAEKQSNPDIADPGPINANLKLYVAAMADVANANKVPFVDLFHPSLQAYADSKRPLTFNGIHLTSEGDKALAPALFKGLFGESAPNADSHERLRSAVIARNELWHSRYRTVDGYNVYGGRSGLAYAPGVGGFKQNEKNPEKPYVSNYQVMQEEMGVRDLMTSNREAAVWAIAKGGDIQVDDSNLPKVETVKTNLPLGSDNFNKTPMSGFKVDPKTGLVAFPSGEEVRKKIKAAPRLKIQLSADEKRFPELVKPVQMAFDTKGRLWVSAWTNYPERTPDSKDGDKLLIFEDTNGDGVADKCITFYDKLNCPTGFQFYKDGVLVMRSPDLLWLRDTNGDDKPDIIERVLSGLCAADSHHETNAMCYEPGGAVYCSDGVFHRTQIETPQGPVRNTDGAIYRYEPRTGKFIRHAAYGFANPHGRVFDYWGNDFITDATGNANYYGPGFSGFIDGGDDGRTKHSNYPQWWQRPSRPCPNTTILSSRHFPDDWNGNFINFNVISIQGIHRVKMEEDGSGIKGTTITYNRDGKEVNTFIECDPAEVGTFRPICGTTAPDGSFYFADWSCAIIGHMQHHLRDPNRDHTTGRIYRVTYEGRDLLEPRKIDGEPVASLLELLKEPENDVRLRAKIELDKHPTGEVISAVQKWVAQFDPKKAGDAHHILEALWVHQWHNVVNLDLIKTVLQSPDPRARAQAVRVALYQRDRIPGVLELIEKAALDENPRVRLEAVRACSFFNGADVPKAMNVSFLVLKQPTDYYLDYCFKETTRQLQSLSKEKILPADPAILGMLLSKMNDDELKGQPDSSEPVALAKLERRSMDLVTRANALAAIAKRHQGSVVAAAVSVLKTLDAAGKGPAAAELGKLLVTQPAPELAMARGELLALAQSAREAAVRHAAWAGAIIAEGKADAVWAAAKGGPEREALIASIPLVPDLALRAQFQPRLAESAATAKGGTLRAVMQALPLMGAQYATANFQLLANHLLAGRDRNTAARAIKALPRDAWDKAQALPIARSILAHGKTLDERQRASEDFAELNQFAMELASLAGDAALRKELGGLGVPVFVVTTVREQMRYDTQRLVVEKGRPFRIVLKNADAMPHNLLVVDPGKHMEVGLSTMTMPLDKKDKQGRAYMPDEKKFRVYGATKLIDTDQKETIEIKGINREGSYEYVCTFPGHSLTMWGVLVVTKDVDEYLAKNPTF